MLLIGYDAIVEKEDIILILNNKSIHIVHFSYYHYMIYITYVPKIAYQNTKVPKYAIFTTNLSHKNLC